MPREDPSVVRPFRSHSPATHRARNYIGPEPPGREQADIPSQEETTLCRGVREGGWCLRFQDSQVLTWRPKDLRPWALCRPRPALGLWPPFCPGLLLWAFHLLIIHPPHSSTHSPTPHPHPAPSPAATEVEVTAAAAAAWAG